MMDCEDMLLFPSLPSAQNEQPDWEYKMRRCMQEIVPSLFLGPYSSASRSQIETLINAGISHIVCIRHPVEANRIKPNFPDRFKYLVLDVQDTPEEHIIRYFPMVRDFIEECLQSQGKVLVHGNGGISRSASLVIAYLMEKYGLPYGKAFYYVQQKRYCINPNEGFVRQLVEYEPIYQARHQLRNREQHTANNNLKRQFTEDTDSDEEPLACLSKRGNNSLT